MYCVHRLESMNKPAQQLLTSPVEGRGGDSNWLAWLTQPLPDRLLLPLAGVWIIGLDWLLFTQESVTLGLATPLAAVLGFVLGGTGVYQFQRRFAGDPAGKAMLKAMLAGLIVGIPIPLAGTVVGGWIVAMSGLAHFKERFLRR
jgi:hypothetical protein